MVPRGTNAADERSVATLKHQYLRFFWATLAAVLLLQATVVTDTILVGRIVGTTPMTGVRVASPVINLLNVFAMFTGVGGSTLVAIAMGRRDREAADRAFTFTIVFSIAIGVVFAAFLFSFAPQVADLISTNKETVTYTATFLRYVGMASPIYILASVMAMLLRADSCIRLSSAVLSVAGISNVLFDLLFMGVLGLGVEGSAFATDCGMLSGVLVSLLYFRWPRRTLHMRLSLTGVGQTLASVSKNGAPGALRMLFSCISLLFLNAVVGASVGTMGIALLTVCGNIQLLASSFFSSGGQAAAPMEGVLFGERDYRGLRLLVSYVFRIVMVAVGILTLVVCLFPAQLFSLFVPQGAPDDIAWLMRLYALGFLPLAANYVLMYYYNTIQRRSLAMMLTVCENLTFYLPLIWILTRSLGLLGAVLSFVLTETLSLGLVLLLARRAKDKQGLDNLLLLPDVPREEVFEVTIRASDVAASHIAHSVKDALDGCGVEPTESLRAAMAAEEMVVAAASYEPNQDRDVWFDVRVSAYPNYVQLALRDDGAVFDPTKNVSQMVDEPEADSISFVRAIASNVDYSPTLGMNQTIIQIDR